MSSGPLDAAPPSPAEPVPGSPGSPAEEVDAHTEEMDAHGEEMDAHGEDERDPSGGDLELLDSIEEELDEVERVLARLDDEER